VQHDCVSDTLQGRDVQCVACLCVRYNARQRGVVCSMPVCQIQLKPVMRSVQQGSEMQCAACLCVRYNARQ
jgi:hypothetical protein